LLAATLIATAPAARATPGDVYVVDQSAQTIWKLPPSGGAATAFSDDPDFDFPYGMVLGPDGFLYVADQGGAVFKVNRTTGDAAELADMSGLDPTDVAIDARRRLLVSEYSNNDVFVVDRTTGARSLLYDGPSGGGFNSLAPQRNGALFIGDEADAVVHRLAGGQLTDAIGPDPELLGLDGVMLSPDERFLYSGAYASPRFARYELRTGEVRKFELGVNPWSFALLPNNRLLFTDANNGDLDTVARTGGATLPFSTDSDLTQVRDIVVEPRRCAGRFPTIVGTNAREVIKGSRFGDVISTLRGNDVIRGLAGNDIVCAGKGRDRLIGGKGRDRLLGGPGRDRLRGGPGRDILRGGPGRDRQRQ
jgi:sugar lactone lactonase YvrE